MEKEEDKEEMLPRPSTADASNWSVGYRISVLVLLLLAYLFNQLDRYTLSIVTKPMAEDLHYGDQACIPVDNSGGNSSIHSSIVAYVTAKMTCENYSTEKTCDSQSNCDWVYTGQGMQYELLAGPVFIVVYTLAGIPLGFWADISNRKNFLAGAVVFWSLMTVLTGPVKAYWQLALLRFLLGIGEAGCTPFATSLIADYFSPSTRALTIGFYNWGIYMGYSLSFALGNFITAANILGQGWRMVYYISGAPGILLGIVIFFVVKEPPRQVQPNLGGVSDFQSLLGHREVDATFCQKTRAVLKTFCRPSLLLLCLGGSIRNAAGYVWAYNTQVYFADLGQTPQMIGRYMSWIPLVGGCVGVVVGGAISDRVIKRVGPHARMIVLIASQFIAAPFIAGALFFDPPWAYISLIPGYIIGEMWVGILLAVLVELVPSPLRTFGVAVYLFIITNIGGNMPLLVPPLKAAFESNGAASVNALRYALYILYPGLYVLAAVIFIVSLIVLRLDISRARRLDYERLS